MENHRARALPVVPSLPHQPTREPPDDELAFRASLEQAKGMLMIHYGIPQHEASASW